MDVDAITARANRLMFGDVDDATILSDINEGILDIASRFAWPWLYSTEVIELVDGTASYALPEGLIQIAEVYFDGQGPTPLERIDIGQVKDLYGDVPGDSALPIRYYQEGLDITFVPTPDSSTQDVIVKCYVLPTALTLGTDEPPFHASFHSMLVDYVVALFWESEEDEQKAQYRWGRYFDSVERMAQLYSVQLPAGPWVLGGGNPRLGRALWANWPE